MDALYIALAVFLFTYALISIRRFPRFKIDRPAAALLGAALMVIFGVVAPEDALSSINVDILVLLVGMMILVAGLELCGFFEWVSLRMIRHSRSQFTFLVLVMVITGILSALVLNDTIVLLFAPIVIRTCRILKSNPVPFVVAVAIAANIGSVATPVGNPQNAFIVTKADVPFTEFSAALIPVAAACMAIGIALMYLIYRKDIEKGSVQEFRRRMLREGWKAFEDELIKGDAPTTKGIMKLKERRTALCALLIVTGFTFAGFVVSGFTGISIALVAFLGGVIALFAVPLLSDVRAYEMIAKVDWTIILFFVGLFVVIEGVKDSSLLSEIQQLFPSFTGGGGSSIGWLTAISAVISNLVSNVPAVMLLSEFIPVSDTELWLALASSSTLAGNATILGAAANVIAVEKAEAMGVEVGWLRFTLVGFPIALATLFVSALILAAIF
jgi:Na+/H+ antiporter NhaD/arsenite permease-like protein